MTSSARSCGIGGKTQNTQNGYANCEDRRGDAAEVAHGFPFDSIDTINFVTMMKRQ
jgi:hypothetical protein